MASNKKELKYKIEICKLFRDEILTNVNSLKNRLENDEIDGLEHRILLHNYLQNKQLEEWLAVYNGQISKFKNQLRVCNK